MVENAAFGTAVGIIAFAADPDGDAISYSLTDSDGGLFAIDQAGVVRVNGGINFEAAESHTIAGAGLPMACGSTMRRSPST